MSDWRVTQRDRAGGVVRNATLRGIDEARVKGWCAAWAPDAPGGTIAYEELCVRVTSSRDEANAVAVRVRCAWCQREATHVLAACVIEDAKFDVCAVAAMSLAARFRREGCKHIDAVVEHDIAWAFRAELAK